MSSDNSVKSFLELVSLLLKIKGVTIFLSVLETKPGPSGEVFVIQQ